MAQSFSNNFTTTLNGNISSGATALTVSSAIGSPSSGQFTIMVYVLNTNGTISNQELMLVTGGQGTNNWTVSRAQEGTAAVSHASGEQVSQMWTLAGLNSLGNGFWPYLSPSGITGATAATRYVGGTASGPPNSGGPFFVGDFVIDQSGFMWVCFTAGSPGTWRQIGGSAPYLCRIHATSSAGVPPSTSFGWGGAVADIDPSGMLTNTGANSAVTIPVTGYWRVVHSLLVPMSGVTTPFQFHIGFSGVTGVNEQTADANNTNVQALMTDLVHFTSGTVVTMQVVNDSSTQTLPAFDTQSKNTYANFELVSLG